MSATSDDIDRIRDALTCIPADDRDVWVLMGMAVKAELGEDGFALWDKWSQGADNYDSKAAAAVWKGIDRNGKVKIGSLFHEAKKYGWKPKPTKEKQASTKRKTKSTACGPYRLVATFNYTDESNNLLYQALRREAA